MRQPISRFKRILIIASATALAFGGAGVAFAYWTSSGQGDGTASTGQAVQFTITAAAPVGVLAPDSAGQTVLFTVTNPGPGTLNLGSVTVSKASPAGVAWVPTGTCLTADYTVSVTTQPTAGPLAANASQTGTATVTLASTGINQDDCKGQTVPLHFVASSAALIV